MESQIEQAVSAAAPLPDGCWGGPAPIKARMGFLTCAKRPCASVGCCHTWGVNDVDALDPDRDGLTSLERRVPTPLNAFLDSADLAWPA